MLARLLLLFIAVPLIELALLLYLADKTSFTFAFALVIVTGVVGSLLARSQGLGAYRRIRQELAEGRMPTGSLVDAVMILCAGALLLTPGILTDLVGLSLLIPPIRRWYKARLVARFKHRVHVFTSGGPRQAPPRDRVIDSYVVDRPEEMEGGRMRDEEG